MNRQSTLCYIEKDGKYLMLHRVVKKNDVNKDKWIGVGGHFEYAESPEECLLREVKEETGYTLTSWKYRGIVTFVYGEDVVEYMSLYTADGFTGDPIECDEGILEWVEKEKIKDLNLWEGDKIFFRLMDEEEEFFSLKLVYNKSDLLEYVALNGKPMELFDVIDEDGNKTGQNAVLHIEMDHCIQRYTSGSCVRIRRVVMMYSFRNEANVRIRTRERMTFLLQGMSVPGMN